MKRMMTWTNEFWPSLPLPVVVKGKCQHSSWIIYPFYRTFVGDPSNSNLAGWSPYGSNLNLGLQSNKGWQGIEEENRCKTYWVLQCSWNKKSRSQRKWKWRRVLQLCIGESRDLLYSGWRHRWHCLFLHWLSEIGIVKFWMKVKLWGIWCSGLVYHMKVKKVLAELLILKNLIDLDTRRKMVCSPS